MPPVWDDARERDLLEEMYFVLSSRQPLSQEDKDAVVVGMKQRGYLSLTWNAIRDTTQRVSRLIKQNMGVAWNADADADLFQAVLAFSPPLTQIPAADREGIVAFMHGRGHTDATWEGIR
ncbi:hypothetical protein F5883DRAFT_667286 [Diaporthe sp. PMI_573]|nr:hypothetical protein F5883DRAFT_667286 [Diaporthaceae sp. PMI_573]